MDYVSAHWRGELPLWRSYWINGALLSVLVVIATTISGIMFEDLDVRPSLAAAAAVSAEGIILGAVSIWQLVGIWRSAGRHIEKTSRLFWASAARLMVIL